MYVRILVKNMWSKKINKKIAAEFRTVSRDDSEYVLS